MSETIFEKIDQFAPGMRPFAEAVVRDVDHALSVEGIQLAPEAYLRRFQRFCYARQAEWQNREDHDYRSTGEIDGHSAYVRRSYYTLAVFCNKASRVA